MTDTTPIRSDEEKKESFIKDVQKIINYHSFENKSDTPDYILAEHLFDCLTVFNNTCNKRTKWYKEN